MTKQLKEIEIPFGAKDSELCSWEYTIPEGMEATIVDNKIVVKKKESWDEKIRKVLIHIVKCAYSKYGVKYQGQGISEEKLLAWLEKKGNIDLEFFENGENEKREFVGYGFLKCKGDFLSFKEGETYWLEYMSKDNYNVRSDNLLGQTFHITPQQLYTVFRPTTWLEKQGQNKLIDKVEPKFKVGDWVVYNRNDHSREVIQIYDIRDNRYYFNDNIHFSWSVKECDEKSHLWTIEDAKDGDVLAFEGYYNSIVLFQGIGINGKGRINYHCKCDLGNYSFGIQGDVACLGTIEEDAKHYHPATKEQRDLLFQKMKEAGYEWDAEKKELKKIEQSPAWSEEDEDMLQSILDEYKSMTTEKRNWLKSLKEKVQPQFTWKPSEHELEVLKLVAEKDGTCLMGLYKQLKKLKEE